jgi:hypothetical protein
MQRLLTDDIEKRGLLASGAGMVRDNLRYIFWFWLLNLTLAEFGTAAFRNQVHNIVDHSLRADRLVHGFDLGVLLEMIVRPEFGPIRASTMSTMYFVMLFFALTALFLPGVFRGYASNYRLPREDFFRACGRNLWRFVRLIIVAGIVMGIAAGILFSGQGVLVKKAGESTYELLPFDVSIACLGIIFLVMTMLRIWFDLAEADVVLSDQPAMRRSIGRAFRHMFRSLGRLLLSYVAITVVAAILLVIGLWAWMKYVPADNVLWAFLIGQLTLLLLLIPRFWQRGVAVSYYLGNMVEAIPAQQFAPAATAGPAAGDPIPAATPTPPPEPQDAKDS